MSFLGNVGPSVFANQGTRSSGLGSSLKWLGAFGASPLVLLLPPCITWIDVDCRRGWQNQRYLPGEPWQIDAESWPASPTHVEVSTLSNVIKHLATASILVSFQGSSTLRWLEDRHIPRSGSHDQFLLVSDPMLM